MTGLLRHRLTIEIPTDLADGMGGIARSWSEHGAVWASVSERAPEEKAGSAGRVMETRRYRVRLRYQALPATYRLRHQGRVLLPLPACDRIGDRRWLNLECVEAPQVS